MEKNCLRAKEDECEAIHRLLLMKVLCFYISVIHCAASGIVIEGKQVTVDVGCGILCSLQGNHIEKGKLRSS